MLMLAFGGLMVLLGLLSGGVLLAAAAGWSTLQPGWTAWLAFPGLTLLGYGLFAAASGDGLSAQLARAFGALCTLLAMAAIAVLVLRSLGILAFEGGTLTLWWVFGCGLVLGPLGWLGAKLPKAA